MFTYLNESASTTQPIFLCNGRCSLVITEITLTEEAFYFINFVLIQMINICPYNKGNFVAFRSHRS